MKSKGVLDELFIIEAEGRGYHIEDEKKFLEGVREVIESGKLHIEKEDNWIDWLDDLLSSNPEEFGVEKKEEEGE